MCTITKSFFIIAIGLFLYFTHINIIRQFISCP